MCVDVSMCSGLWDFRGSIFEPIRQVKYANCCPALRLMQRMMVVLYSADIRSFLWLGDERCCHLLTVNYLYSDLLSKGICKKCVCVIE